MYIIDLESSEVTLVDKFEIDGDTIIEDKRPLNTNTSDGPVTSRKVEKIESYRDEVI